VPAWALDYLRGMQGLGRRDEHVKPYRHKSEGGIRLGGGGGRLLRRLVHFTLVSGSWISALFVVVYAAMLRFLGEDWWATTVALYLPHWVLLAPICLLALGALAFGPRLLLLLHTGAAALVLFSLMGLELGGPVEPTPGAPRLRVISYNVGSGARSIPGIVAEVLAAKPDLVLLQETAPAVNEAVAAALPGYFTAASTQFFIASRGEISNLYEPPKLGHAGALRSARFLRATVNTSLGQLDVYNIHPISPREALTSIHDESFLGGAGSGDHRVITQNTALRRLQVEAISDLAVASPLPVLLGGDTNLPQNSRLLEGLGPWKDGFSEVGRGLGYTFPVTRRGPWMRIDRILAGPQLRFLSFGTGESESSDHHCVWAELELAAQR
jgi:endonuclease/exonuclease/phosphatase (EEP) superfamily protein YafD